MAIEPRTVVHPRSTALGGLLDGLAHCVVWLDADGAVLHLNEPAEDLSGISRNQAAGRAIRDLLKVNVELDGLISRARAAGAQYSEKKRSFFYGQFLTGVSVKIAKNPLPLLLILGAVAVVGFAVDPLIPVQTNENSFVPGDMPAKINIDKVTRILGATSTADFYVRGYGTDLETIRWIAQFQDYEMAHHSELTGGRSIVTTILAYNGGVMPETQADLDQVLQSIPEATRNQYLSGSMSSVIKFSTIDLEMSQMNSLKHQMIDDIAFLEGR